MEEANEKYIKKVLRISNLHMKKHGCRKMSLKELDELCTT